MIYDTLLDLFKLIFGTIEFFKPFAVPLGILVLLLKQNNIKKVINGRLPKRFRDTQSSDIYDMMRDIKLIKEHLGVVESSNTQQNGQETIRTLKFKRFFLFLQMAMYPKRRVLKMNLSGKKKILAIGAAILINGCNDVFQLHLTPETIKVISGLGGGYVLLEAVIDIVRAWSNKQKEVVVIDAIPTIDTSSNK